MAEKKYELIGKLENLGPFQLFFTLSCAEKRWNENVTTFLQDHKIEYYVENSKEYCTIDGISMEEFLQREENLTKHEFIRKNILTTTLNFNNRVQEFIKNIVMNKHSPLAVEYYSYRVEFQLCGAAHIHGTIWVNWMNIAEKMIKTNLFANNENHDPDDVETMIKEKVEIFKKAFEQMRNEELGMGSIVDDDEHKKIIDALVEFTDWCVSCSLKDPTTRDLVMDVNNHKHLLNHAKNMVQNANMVFLDFLLPRH